MRDASRDCVPCTAATGLPYHLARRDDFDRFCRQPPLGRSLRVGGMRGKLQLVARVHGFVSKRYKPFTLDKGNETKNSNLRRLDEGCGHECKTSHLKEGWTRGLAMNARRRGKDERLIRASPAIPSRHFRLSLSGASTDRVAIATSRPCAFTDADCIASKADNGKCQCSPERDGIVSSKAHGL
jgi:hypothetical protein